MLRKVVKNDTSNIVCDSVDHMANLLKVSNILSRVALEMLYRTGATRKYVHSNFEDKIC